MMKNKTFLLLIFLLTLCTSCSADVKIPEQKIKIIDKITKKPITDAYVKISYEQQREFAFENFWVNYKIIELYSDSQGLIILPKINIPENFMRKYYGVNYQVLHPFYFKKRTGILKKDNSKISNLRIIELKSMESIIKLDSADKVTRKFSLILDNGLFYLKNKSNYNQTDKIKKKYNEFFGLLKKKYSFSEGQLYKLNSDLNDIK